MTSFPSLSSKIKWVSGILFVTLILDQWSKMWARESLGTDIRSYWNHFFVFEHSENTGAFLSLGANMSDSFRFWFFTIGVSAVSLGALWYIFKKKDLTLGATIAYTMMVAGGVGNLIDRIHKGSVTDFMNMGFGPVRTGIFNVADVAIMAAAGVLLVFGAPREPEQS